MDKYLLNILIAVLTSFRDQGFSKTGFRVLRRILRKRGDSALRGRPSLIPGFDERELLAIHKFRSRPTPQRTQEDSMLEQWLWLIPPFGEYSGGHSDIFLLCSRIQTITGSRVKIAVTGAISEPDLINMRTYLKKFYRHEDLQIESIENVYRSSFKNVVATGWQTVASSLSIDAIERWYFVQDYEPWFFISGSQQEIIKSLYIKDFRYFVIGPWLKKQLRFAHDLDSYAIPFSLDTKTYKLPALNAPRDKIVVYARISSPRRAVEIILEALKIIEYRLIGNYEIIFIGQNIDIDFSFSHKSISFMGKHELSLLYQSAKVVIAFSTTNTSLVPIEALACGSRVLINDNEINRTNLAGLPIDYVSADPFDVAAKIIEITQSAHEDLALDVLNEISIRDWDLTSSDFTKWILQ
jgi:glycosyltransferase involved in cell wall biosynthesis